VVYILLVIYSEMRWDPAGFLRIGRAHRLSHRQ